MIECPTCHAVPSRCGGARRDLAEGGQINDTGSQKSIRAGRDGGGEGNRLGGMLVQFRGCRIDRRSERRTISPRLGAFRDPLIAAITVIIDLLRARAITIGPRNRKQPVTSRGCVGRCNGVRGSCDVPADSASGGNRI